MFEKSIVAVRPFKLALLASLMLAAAAASAPAVAASANATASANVIVPISVTKATDLSFGKFAAGAGGTISLSTSGTVTKTGVTAASGTPTVASFTIAGEPSTGFAVDTIGTTANVTGGAGSDTMALALITDFTAGGSANPTTGTLDGAGSKTLYVGGTLTVGATQAAGSYSGTVVVNVAYN